MLSVMMCGRCFIKRIALVCLLITCKSAVAQIVGGDYFLNSLNSAYVKSIDEFIQRFNAEEFHPGIYYEEEENLRTRSLLSLFDWQRFQNDDSTTINLLISFADSVCWNDIRLNMEGGGIYAEAQCLFEYGQQEVPINIVFAYENIRDDYYKWAVVGATGLIEAKILDTSCNGYLNPIQHELHFSDLASACESDLTRFVSYDRSIDQLFFLLGMIKTGQLKFVSCNNILFHFTQMPNYIFVVDKANRLSYNSGYLINSLLEVDETSKREYIEQLLGTITR